MTITNPKVEPNRMRAATSRFATGVTVVTTFDGRKREGLTVNSFSSLSLDPALVLWSIRKHAPSVATFLRAEGFAVNVIAAGSRNLSQHFATSRPDKLVLLTQMDGLAVRS